MKTATIVLIVFVLGIISQAQGQTRQERRVIRVIEAQISKAGQEISALTADTLRAHKKLLVIGQELAQYNEPLRQRTLINEQKKLRDLIPQKREKIKTKLFLLEELEREKDLLLGIVYRSPVEDRALSNIEARRRHNAIGVEKQRVSLERDILGLKKLDQTPAHHNGVMGYKVLIWNQDLRRSGNFSLTDLSGENVDGVSVFLGPGEKLEVFLLPGEYIGKVQLAGGLEKKTIVRVSPRIALVNGGEYHGYLIQPRR